MYYSSIDFSQNFPLWRVALFVGYPLGCSLLIAHRRPSVRFVALGLVVVLALFDLPQIVLNAIGGWDWLMLQSGASGIWPTTGEIGVLSALIFGPLLTAWEIRRERLRAGIVTSAPQEIPSVTFSSGTPRSRIIEWWVLFLFPLIVWLAGEFTHIGLVIAYRGLAATGLAFSLVEGGRFVALGLLLWIGLRCRRPQLRLLFYGGLVGLAADRLVAWVPQLVDMSHGRQRTFLWTGLPDPYGIGVTLWLSLCSLALAVASVLAIRRLREELQNLRVIPAEVHTEEIESAPGWDEAGGSAAERSPSPRA